MFSHRAWVSDFPDFECLSGRSPVLGSSLIRSVGTKWYLGISPLPFWLQEMGRDRAERISSASQLEGLVGP